MVEDFINLAGEAGDLNGVQDILDKSPDLINARNQVLFNCRQPTIIIAILSYLINFCNRLAKQL